MERSVKERFETGRRLVVKILVPKDIKPEELRFNLKHCTAENFNKFKPDAIRVYAFKEGISKDDYIGLNSTGEVIFAPFGKWEKAQGGVAYNIPTSEFQYIVKLNAFL